MGRKLNHVRNHKDRYTTPKKGTKKRQIVIALLNPQGANVEQLKVLGVREPSDFFNDLREQCGFDIQTIGYLPSASGKGRPRSIYRIIGRYRWKGGYRSFLEG